MSDENETVTENVATDTETPSSVSAEDTSGGSDPEGTAEASEATEEAPQSLAKKYRNKSKGPVAFDSPSHGTSISLPSKHCIWLWPEDVADGTVARYIDQKILVLWDDGEQAPLTRTGLSVLPKTRTQRERLAREAADDEDRSGKQPFAEVVKEGDELEREQPASSLSAFGGKGASTGGAEVHSAADVASSSGLSEGRQAGGGSKRTRARGSSFKRP